MIQSIILYSSSACSCEAYSYKDTKISDHVFIPSSPIRKKQQIHLQKIVCFFNGLRKDFNVKRVYLIDGQTGRQTDIHICMRINYLFPKSPGEIIYASFMMSKIKTEWNWWRTKRTRMEEAGIWTKNKRRVQSVIQISCIDRLVKYFLGYMQEGTFLWRGSFL